MNFAYMYVLLRLILFLLSASISLQKTERVDFSWNELADPKFTFHDHSLVETVREGNLEAQAFFRLLALCHTVMPEEKKEGEPPLMDVFVTTWQGAAEVQNRRITTLVFCLVIK